MPAAVPVLLFQDLTHKTIQVGHLKIKAAARKIYLCVTMSLSDQHVMVIVISVTDAFVHLPLLCPLFSEYLLHLPLCLLRLLK